MPRRCVHEFELTAVNIHENVEAPPPGGRNWYWNRTDPSMGRLGVVADNGPDGDLRIRYVVRYGQKRLHLKDEHGHYLHFIRKARLNPVEKGLHRNPEQVKALAMEWLEAMRRGEEPGVKRDVRVPREETLRSAIARHVADKRKAGVSANWCRDIENALTKNFRAVVRLHHKSLWEITPDDIEDAFDDVCAKHGKGAATDMFRQLHRMYERELARETDPRKLNPVAVLRRLGDKYQPEKKPNPEALSDAELAAVIKAINDWEPGRYRTISLIALMTGFRSERASGLRWDHIRERDGKRWLFFPANEHKARGRGAGREQWYPLLPELDAVLDAARTEVPSRYVTPNTTYTTATKKQVWCSQLYKRAGVARVEGANAKRLRQTVATHVAVLCGDLASAVLCDHALRGAPKVTEHYVHRKYTTPHEWAAAWYRRLAELGLKLPTLGAPVRVDFDGERRAA